MAPEKVGIKAIELYFPSRYVAQTDLEQFLGASTGKFTVGLGQTNMSFCDDREDVHSLALTAVSSLLRKYNISTSSIGRLEVGTESMVDKAKSCKSVLMQLFGSNTDIEGADTYNACYGGTSALLNAVNWIESSSWDGRDAIVVASDIAIYNELAARPTGGAGCVALLVGPDAPLVVEPLRASYMAHTYDFYKPDFKHEYPILDGHYSSRCYLQALDGCYQRYQAKSCEKMVDMSQENGYVSGSIPVDRFDFFVFHAPNCKLVSKAYGRLHYIDFLADPEHPIFRPEADFSGFRDQICEKSFDDKGLERFFMAFSHTKFTQRVQPSLTAPTMCGNMYTAGVFSALASLLSNVSGHDLVGKHIGAFSFGSGLASTLFSLHVAGDASGIAERLDLHSRLASRVRTSPDFYHDMCVVREKAYQQKSYTPVGDIDALASGTYYLEGIDEMFRRTYAVKE